MEAKQTYQAIIDSERAQRFANWQLCPAEKNILDIEELFCTSPPCCAGDQQMTVFCFDYVINPQQGHIWIYAHLEENFKFKKVRFRLTNFKVYLNVLINYSMVQNANEWDAIVRSVQIDQGKRDAGCHKCLGDIVKMSTPINLKIFKGYNEKPREFSHVRYEFENFSQYDKFKQTLNGANQKFYESLKPTEQTQRLNAEIFKRAAACGLRNPIFKMSEDDTTKNYICKLQREHEFVLSGWNSVKLRGLRLLDGRLYGECDIGEIKRVEGFAQVPLSILSWDIEMSTKTGKFDNNALDPLNNIVCIGCSYADPIDKRVTKFCITYLPCSGGTRDSDTHLIMVGDEREMLLQFAKVLYTLDPSLVTGFNDFNFDWPFVKDRLQFFGIGKQFRDQCCPQFTSETGQQNLFSHVDIKINASDKKTGQFPMITGTICADTRIILIKSQKIEKKSLNEYLKANKLPVKLDVDFKDMNSCFRKYFNGNKVSLDDSALMFHVMEYCAHDADCCRLLWEKRNVLQEHLEIANLSFTPLGYAFNKANGIKVRNMVAYFASKKGFSMPMSPTSSDQRWTETEIIDKYGKYPGAYVPAPQKGVNVTPVVALDFASLYPSIIMAHNLSPENIIVDEKGALIASQVDQATFVTVPFENGDEKEEISGSVIASAKQPGLYPSILRDLFNKRKQVKQQIERLEKIVQVYEIIKSTNSPTTQQIQQVEEVMLTLNISESLLEKSAQYVKDLLRIDEIKFQIQLLDAKQVALKVYMNTFYGETGNKKSPFFDLIVAGGTTTFGKKYIMMVHKMVSEFDCEVVYGDTDSIYLRPRASHYNLSNPVNTYDLIGSALEIAASIRDTINKTMGELTDNVLRMEFEEVLCPSLFMGKKKYCGVKHKSVMLMEKIDQSDILIKGIDFIKSQYPIAVKQAGYQLLIDLMQNFSRFDRKYTPDEAQRMFKDSARSENNEIVKNCILKSVTEFRKRIKSITPEHYDCLATRKKIREGKKGGEMMLFKERFKSNEDILQIVETISKASSVTSTFARLFKKIDPDQIRGRIDPRELQELGIELPQEGEIIDIVYVETFPGAKASQKMHLLQFAKMKQIPIDTSEYEEMFNTTAKRMLVCYFAEDEDEKKQMQQAKILISQHLCQTKQPKVQTQCQLLKQELEQAQQLLDMHMQDYLDQGNYLLKEVAQKIKKDPSQKAHISTRCQQRLADLETKLENALKNSCVAGLFFLFQNEKQYNDLCCSVNQDIQQALTEFAVNQASCLSDQMALEDLHRALDLAANCVTMETIINNQKTVTKCRVLKRLKLVAAKVFE